jgi:hypothetical protein
MSRRSHVVRNTRPTDAVAVPIPGGGGGEGGIGIYEMVWTVPGLIYPQKSAVYTTPVDLTLDSITTCFEVAPTGGTHRIVVYRNGASVATADMPAGYLVYAWPIVTAIDTVGDIDRWQMAVTTVGTGTPSYMSVAVRYK